MNSSHLIALYQSIPKKNFCSVFFSFGNPPELHENHKKSLKISKEEYFKEDFYSYKVWNSNKLTSSSRHF